jgi:hypothetical protein
MSEIVGIIENSELPSQIREAVQGIVYRDPREIKPNSIQSLFLQAILAGKSFVLGIPPTGGPQLSAPGTPIQRDPRDITFKVLWDDRAKREALNATDLLRFVGPVNQQTFQNPADEAFIYNDSTKGGQSEIFLATRNRNRLRADAIGNRIQVGSEFLGNLIESVGLRSNLLSQDIWVEVTVRPGTPARIRAVLKVGDFNSDTLTRPAEELTNVDFARRVISEFSGLRRAGVTRLPIE